MPEMPGIVRPDLQALPQIRDRMTFLYRNDEASPAGAHDKRYSVSAQ